MVWVALGRCAGGGGRLSSILSLFLTSLTSSLVFTFLCFLTLAFTLITFTRAENIFEEGKSDKEILDNLLLSTRYDKRLLPPVQGTLRPPSYCPIKATTTYPVSKMTLDHPEHLRTSSAPLPPHSTTQPQLTAHPSSC